MRLAFIALAAACGGSSPLVPDGAHHQYVISKLGIIEGGLDLDGDGQIDNVLGPALAALDNQGYPIQESIDAAVAEGHILLLLDVQGDASSTVGGLRLYFGTNARPPACETGEVYQCAASVPPVCFGCQHHLAGTASFDIVDASTSALVGPIAQNAFSAGPGAIPFQLAVGGSDVVAINLLGARVSAPAFSALGTSAPMYDGLDNLDNAMIIGGAISQADVWNLVAAWQRSLGPIIARDCCGSASSPGGATCNPMASCGCVPDSLGDFTLRTFDTNPKDCSVSVQEIEQSSLAQSYLFSDVSIDGQRMVSFGIVAQPVPATFQE